MKGWVKYFYSSVPLFSGCRRCRLQMITRDNLATTTQAPHQHHLNIDILPAYYPSSSFFASAKAHKRHQLKLHLLRIVLSTMLITGSYTRFASINTGCWVHLTLAGGISDCNSVAYNKIMAQF